MNDRQETQDVKTTEARIKELRDLLNNASNPKRVRLILNEIRTLEGKN